MWSPDRRALLLTLAALGGCGFAPLHQGGDALAGLVIVEPPPTADGWALRRRIEERVGPPTDPDAATLRVGLSVDDRAAAIDAEGRTNRVELLGRADWSYRGRSGVATAFTGYQTTGSTIAVEAAERDARARLMGLLADAILTDLRLGPVAS